MEEEYKDKKVLISMKISRSLHEAGQDKAAEDNRSFSNYVCNLIMLDLRREKKKIDKKVN